MISGVWYLTSTPKNQEPVDSNMMSILADYPINTLYARYLTEMLGVMSDHGQPKMPSSNSYKNIEVTNNNTLTCECLTNLGMQNYLPGKGIKKIPANEDTIVPIELAQIDGNEFVPIELAQIPSVLFSTGWSNHQLIMSQCKSDEQRLFYILYSGHEQLEYKQLERALKTDAMSSILGSKNVQSEMMKHEYPQSGLLFKDTVYLEMLGLPLRYKESKLRKEIIGHMKDFILEMGKDFPSLQRS